MDRSRNDEALRAISRTLDSRGGPAWRRERPADEASRRRLIRDKLDRIDRGTPLNEYLPPAARRGEVGAKLRSLQERYLRPYPSLIRILVETDEHVEFLPGQYLSVRYGGRSGPTRWRVRPTATGSSSASGGCPAPAHPDAVGRPGGGRRDHAAGPLRRLRDGVAVGA